MAYRAGFTSRTKARKRALDVLFEADQKGCGDTAVGLLDILEQRKEVTAAQTPLPAYAIEAVQGVAEHIEQIDELLATYSQGWTLARMPGVDRAALRLGTWEILFNDDVDANVAIDEAITIVKALSTDDSANFVNGLLGTIKTLQGLV